MRLIIPTLCVTALITASAPHAAELPMVQRDYPSKPIRVVVPYAAGGPMDYIARMLGRKMQNLVVLVIDNRPGAGGATGADLVAKAAPDGYTMLHTSSSHASLPVITKSLPYDPIKDFTPVTLIVNSVGFLFVAHPSVPARNVQEFVADAKAHPGKFTYGSGGVGNVMHFAAEIFNVMAGTQITHVPYKGVSQAITDLLGGRIDTAIGPGTTLLPHIRAGKLKALGITATSRWSELPDTPTIDEAGVKGYVFVPWYGFWFPARTPAAYVNWVRGEMVKALDDAEIRRAFADQGFAAAGSTPAEFAKTIAAEIDANKRLAAKIGLTPE
jgi:tripartite-type tricarboxylate transporter receptor subunit TctC